MCEGYFYYVTTDAGNISLDAIECNMAEGPKPYLCQYQADGGVGDGFRSLAPEERPKKLVKRLTKAATFLWEPVTRISSTRDLIKFNTNAKPENKPLDREKFVKIENIKFSDNKSDDNDNLSNDNESTDIK